MAVLWYGSTWLLVETKTMPTTRETSAATPPIILQYVILFTSKHFKIVLFSALAICSSEKRDNIIHNKHELLTILL